MQGGMGMNTYPGSQMLLYGRGMGGGYGVSRFIIYSTSSERDF